MNEINTYALLRDPEMKEILDSFLVETKEILDNLDLDLVLMESKPHDTELLNQVFRSFHTIKGTSGFLGLEKLTTVTHRCEDILNKLRKGEVGVNQQIMDSILLAFDKIKELLGCIETDLNENVETEIVIQKLEATINNLQSDDALAVNNPEATAEERTQPSESKEESVNSEIVKPISGEKEVLPDPAKENKKQVDNTIRVDIERLDELLNIASELVLGRNRLAQVNSEFALEYEGTKISRDLAEASRQIDLMTNELQLVVMKTRMVKIGKVFNRFPRVVRDLSKEIGKTVIRYH